MSKRPSGKNIWIVELLMLVSITVLVIGTAFFLMPAGDFDEFAGIAEEEVVHSIEYGIIVDSLEVIRDNVKRNEFLADILLKYDVDYNLIDQIARSPRDVFDVKKIRAGYPYSVIRSLDSLQSTYYFIYEQSPTEYVVFDLRDTLIIYKGEKDLERRLTSSSGTISSSLWNTMVDNGADPNLANEMSEIYAWTIDFFGIQKGDNFRVIYEELYVEDEYIGLGKVVAANFNHIGYDYYACFFEQDSCGDYYDDEGGKHAPHFSESPITLSQDQFRVLIQPYASCVKIQKASPWG